MSVENNDLVESLIEVPLEEVIETVPPVEELVETSPYVKTDDGWTAVVDLGDGSGVQRFAGKTEHEVSRKLLQAQINASRKIRQQERLLKLGEGQPLIPDTETVLPDFKPRELTVDEQMDIARQIQDPNQAILGVTRLLEAQFGASLSTVRDAIRLAPEIQAALKARTAAEQFAAAHPEYVQSLKNAKVVIAWLEKRGYGPTLKNFELAYADLQDSGLLELQTEEAQPGAVSPEPVATTTPPAVPIPARIETEPVVVRPRVASTSLSSRGTSARPNSAPRTAMQVAVTVTELFRDPRTGKTGSRTVEAPLTSRLLEQMSVDDYRRNLIQTPGFKEAVDKLLTPQQ